MKRGRRMTNGVAEYDTGFSLVRHPPTPETPGLTRGPGRRALWTPAFAGVSVSLWGSRSELCRTTARQVQPVAAALCAGRTSAI